MSFSKSSLAAHKAISAIYLMVSKIYLYSFMRLIIDYQITVYQSLFINKANVNRGSRNGMTCTVPEIQPFNDQQRKLMGGTSIQGVHYDTVPEIPPFNDQRRKLLGEISI